MCEFLKSFKFFEESQIQQFPHYTECVIFYLQTDY